MSKQSKTVLFAGLALAIGLLLGRFLLAPDAGSATARVPPLRVIDRYAYGVSHILIRSGPGTRTHGEALKLVELAYDALRRGAPFAEVAKGRSEDAAAADGGFLGFVPHEHETTFAGAVQALHPGEMSPPISTQRGWQILKRHTYEETVALERKLWIPTLGFYVAYGDAPNAEGRTREEAFDLATEAMNKLAAGQITIEQARAQFTNEPRPPPEAFAGMTANRPHSKAAYDALKNAEVGQIVGPVDAPDGWGVLIRGRFLRSFMRHILVQHAHSRNRAQGVTRSKETARELAQRALDEALADRSRWTSLVERYTDHMPSRFHDGAMGVMGPGLMPKGFEKYLYDTPPGEICKHVVETPFGFHVVWRVN